jgi:hypothetical protein
MDNEERITAARIRQLTKVNMCNGCHVAQIDCPYPGAFNSKELEHQGCEKYQGRYISMLGIY